MTLTGATPDTDPATEHHILSLTRLYTNHPHAGQDYLDFFPLLSNPSALELVISTFVTRIVSTYDVANIAAIVYPEAQGFILGPLVASRLHLPAVAVRKPGKLAGDVWRWGFGKWGGASDSLEMQRGAFEGVCLTGTGGAGEGKVKGAIVVDDSVATGGSVGAVRGLLLERWGIPVLEVLTIVEATWGEFSKAQDANGLADVKIFAMCKLTEGNMAGMRRFDGRRDASGKRLGEEE
ncbi:hypothetical protein BLS_003956 [Venturia inaequalis]|uniref:adenine phosphoribosyltransferase n=1 Tax=Venturia inaequalis TaxID=5025 RepID=A0A8H3YUM2_VENIN|nr:hypothetical protein EG328_007777 [Venturia inaequalis]KAE9972563.1 hypothetical protein BLS_003956 [Venturia inaequalis]RDI87743.1 hypothetical protein Vi05172_g2572 [Venturia inaequalis]